MKKLFVYVIVLGAGIYIGSCAHLFVKQGDCLSAGGCFSEELGMCVLSNKCPSVCADIDKAVKAMKKKQ